MEKPSTPLPPKVTCLLAQLRAFMRARQYAYRTEKVYCHWVLQYIRFHDHTDPRKLDGRAVQSFLTYLSLSRNVSGNTQKLALNALMFMYKHFLQMDLGNLAFLKASRPRSLPVAFSHDEALAVIRHLRDDNRLVVSLMYGAGLRVMEAVRLRIADIDFANQQIVVRASRDENWRRCILPENLLAPLRQQIVLALALHARDTGEIMSARDLPRTLQSEFAETWQHSDERYLFPAATRRIEPHKGVEYRHHVGERQVQRAVKQALTEAGITKKASCHTFRHSFAMRLLEAGADLSTLQEALGHRDIKSTHIYAHLFAAMHPTHGKGIAETRAQYALAA